MKLASTKDVVNGLGTFLVTELPCREQKYRVQPGIIGFRTGIIGYSPELSGTARIYRVQTRFIGFNQRLIQFKKNHKISKDPYIRYTLFRSFLLIGVTGMIELMLTMLERLGIIVTVAFVLTRLRFFRHMINQPDIDRKHQISAMLFFGLFGIIGTYTGVKMDTDTLQLNQWVQGVGENEAIANSRVIGIVIAGLLGGYKVGIGAGIIAGAHRYLLGGFTGLACSLSAVISGILAGAIRKRQNGKPLKASTAFFTGALAETIQMSIILLISKPFDQALILVQGIGLPMIIANGVGSLLFLLIMQNVLNEEEKVGAIQAQKALKLAELTLAHLRKGLSIESAKEVCKILYKEVDASAIAMTNQDRILAHVGLADDHHMSNVPIQTDITKQVLLDGQLHVADHDNIHCVNVNCPLTAVVVAPLKVRSETIGTLKFYFRSEKEISNVMIQLINGLSSLLSNQLEMAEVEKTYQMAKELEIKALQAQINPHFLFNSLNTIVSLTRIEPAKARKLLISLSRYFRQNLSATTKTSTTLEQELKHVQAYLEIEETRFVDRLIVDYDIEENALITQIPPLTLQPIVENSIKHGIKEKEENCKITIEVKMVGSDIFVAVHDNGLGIEQDKLEGLGKQVATSKDGTGIGLYNVNRRLIMMYGQSSALQIKSVAGKGTTVFFIIPPVIEWSVEQ